MRVLGRIGVSSEVFFRSGFCLESCYCLVFVNGVGLGVVWSGGVSW